MNRDLPPHRQPIYRYRHNLSALTLPTSNETAAAESCSLFIVLRHRTPSSPICFSEVIHKLLALSRVFLLIQRRKKCPSREEKSAFTQWYSSIYVRSLKDQARQSKYPRTQILEPRTQSKLICHSSATFIPTQTNNLIELTSQSYIGIQVKLYRNQSKAIQLSSPSHITLSTYSYTYYETIV